MKWVMHSKFIYAIAEYLQSHHLSLTHTHPKFTELFLNEWIRIKFGFSTHIITSASKDDTDYMRFDLSLPFAESRNSFLSPFTKVKGNEMWLFFGAWETKGIISGTKISSFHGTRLLLE